MLWVVIAALLLSHSAAARQNSPVSLVVDEAPVAQVLQALAGHQRQNLVAAPEIKGNISLSLNNVPWRQAMNIVAHSAGLEWRKEGNVLFVTPGGWRHQQEQQRAQERQARLQQAPLRSESLVIHYADVAELAEQLKATGHPGMSARGSVVADRRTNRLLILDTADRLREVKQWVAEMDIPVGQVELSAHIVTIASNSLRELGIKWAAAGPAEGQGKLLRPTGVSADLSVGNASTQVGFNIGRIDGRFLSLELSALEQQNKVDIIASPRLLASHRQPASIKQGSEIPYQVSSGESGATSVEFKEAVLGMEVTPTVLSRGRVQLKLRISQNMPGQKLQQGDGEVLAIDKQEIETQVEVQDGETIALGGIFRHKQRRAEDRVPVLSSVPLLGHLFRHRGKEQERHELVVFITPRLLATK
ncbi:DNA uptake porin HofQ [Entomohabitans teleogrylli]|uniref:DNA uptake porin HofQ n=1 Tax=Entomohabitans teleogrylli TaxID=1384589 RepID=UPI00073D65BE